jgi:hypothetical protein
MLFSMPSFPPVSRFRAPWLRRFQSDRVAAPAVTLPTVFAAADPDEEDDDLGDEEDLSVAQPAADEDSAFDDFDDDFDDDFEEEEDDPDWDHPDDGEGDTPPAGKGPSRKK